MGLFDVRGTAVALPEALFVVDGRLELEIEGAPVPVGAGEMYRVPAGVRHAVRPGSHGTPLVFETVVSD
ncbi:cupin domain-containing protein [Streptomyces sp. NPDC004539]|uniref:cupin domain-containing protein n=1 Tax=Streptomyces sp. NPDC004539 TaxID=3154280 RepID=UPI0033BCC8BF